MNPITLGALTSIIVPLGVVVVLPIVIAYIAYKKKQHETNKRTEIIMAAIEKNSDIDEQEFLSKLNPLFVCLLWRIKFATSRNLMGYHLFNRRGCLYYSNSHNELHQRVSRNGYRFPCDLWNSSFSNWNWSVSSLQKR